MDKTPLAEREARDRETEDLVDGFSRVLEYGANCVANALGRLHGDPNTVGTGINGADGAMDPGIKAILPEFAKFCGPARTIKWGPWLKTDVQTRSGGAYDLFNNHTASLKPGEVLIIDLDGNHTWSSAPYGGNRNMLTKARGVVGVVVDGYVRDLSELKQNPLPIFCRGTSVRMQGLRPTAVDVPVSCGGLTVRPDDIVCADETGVVVVPRDEARQVLKTSIDIMPEGVRKRLRIAKID